MYTLLQYVAIRNLFSVALKIKVHNEIHNTAKNCTTKCTTNCTTYLKTYFSLCLGFVKKTKNKVYIPNGVFMLLVEGLYILR